MFELPSYLLRLSDRHLFTEADPDLRSDVLHLVATQLEAYIDSRLKRSPLMKESNITKQFTPAFMKKVMLAAAFYERTGHRIPDTTPAENLIAMDFTHVDGVWKSDIEQLSRPQKKMLNDVIKRVCPLYYLDPKPSDYRYLTVGDIRARSLDELERISGFGLKYSVLSHLMLGSPVPMDERTIAYQREQDRRLSIAKASYQPE